MGFLQKLKQKIREKKWLLIEDREEEWLLVEDREEREVEEEVARGKLYSIVRSVDGKYAIFQGERRVSAWWDEILGRAFLNGESEYYVAMARVGDETRYAVYHVSGVRKSVWLSEILIEGLIKGKSDYYVGKYCKKGWAIFNKNGRRVTDWFDEIVGKYGVINGESEYFIAGKVKEGRLKYAVFSIDGRQITKWAYEVEVETIFETIFMRERRILKEILRGLKETLKSKEKKLSEEWEKIYVSGLVRGKSNYYVVENENGKEAIFDKDGRQISEWWDCIVTWRGLVEGESDYYIVENSDGGEAIFDVRGRKVSDWFEVISWDGLVRGESKYYIAKWGGKYAIFDVEGKNISEWWDGLSYKGLVKGESDYYVVWDEEMLKEAIFDKNGRKISDWWDEIGLIGLVEGKSEYYVAMKKEGEQKKYALFHVEKGRVSDWWDCIYEEGVLNGTSKSLYVVRDGERLGLMMLGKKEALMWVDHEKYEWLVEVIRKSGSEKIFEDGIIRVRRFEEKDKKVFLKF